MNNAEPLPFYKEIVYYVGLVALISFGLVIYSVIGTNMNSHLMISSMLSALIFGSLAYFMWATKCPYCKRSFSKKEQIEWKEDLGIKKEPYVFYSKMYKYSDGSTEPIENSKKTIMRDKKYDRQYYVCKTCKYGKDKEWSEIKSKWLGEEPKIQYVNKKGNSKGFGIDLFEEDSYEYRGKRKNIPRAVKEDLWIKHFGKKYFGNCLVCGTTMETNKFEAGHIKSVANGGSDNMSNLKPICMKCNRAMGTRNLYEYKNEYYSNKNKN
ncbi:MAG: HNH endonuclease signature motif containing protein [Candidatus Nanoarchaeia archaeon]|nr:HNH endonuclease signature motif containing protein [Candidatus Nanoarchaeia archaeon]